MERQKPRAPRTCKICESEDHLAKECPNRVARTCRKCGSEDHMAKECDIVKCTNWYVELCHTLVPIELTRVQ